MAWDPSQYLKFAAARTRPAADLLGRVPLEAPTTVVDLGCGPGNSTELLAARWPAARILGVDSSEAMLKAARQAHPEWAWACADIGAWEPEDPVDLLFSNAALHWLSAHDRLLPRLMGFLAPGGVLAVQMPCNFDAPAHRLGQEIAHSGPWQERFAGLQLWHPPLDPAAYHRILAPHASSLDLWETEYQQVMADADAIVAWARGTALLPFLERLDEAEQAGFLARYRAAVDAAYPPETDGRRLFPFRRIFLVAQR